MLIRAPIALTVTLCFARLILSGARCRSGGCCEEVCGTYCDENHACHSDDERCQNVGEASERLPAMTEAEFRWGHNQDAMANDKLAEGIRRFDADQVSLEERLAERLR